MQYSKYMAQSLATRWELVDCGPSWSHVDVELTSKLFEGKCLQSVSTTLVQRFWYFHEAHIAKRLHSRFGCLHANVSVSIFRFVKAMRDDQGELLPNAHLIGFLRRICKLLYLSIRPVFVFDGSTPALKKQTLQERRRRREQQDARVRKTAEKLLMNRLKQHALEEVRKKAEQNAIDGHIIGPSGAGGEGETGENIENGGDAKQQEDHGKDTNLKKDEIEKKATLSSSSDEESDGEFEVEIDDTIDHEVLSTLPPSMQLEVMLQIREKAMSAARGGFEERNGKPVEFSEYQIQQYLNATGLRRKVDLLKGSSSQQADMARPIAAEEGKEYVLTRLSPEKIIPTVKPEPKPVVENNVAPVGPKHLQISFCIDQKELESEDELEWEDIEVKSQEAPQRSQRSKFWTLSHGFHKGRSLGNWGTIHQNQMKLRRK